MNYKLAMAIVAELQALMILLADPDARWKGVQAWLKSHPRWRRKVNHYVAITPAEAVADLKAFLIEETGLPESLVNLAITPEMEMKAKLSIERLQTLYKLRKAQDTKPKEITPHVKK